MPGADDQPIPVFEWSLRELDFLERADFVAEVGPTLAKLVPSGGSVLDLCCGTGTMACFLAEQGAGVVGIDLSPRLIGQARREAAKRGVAVEYRCGNVLTCELGEASVDLVICLGNGFLDFPHRMLGGFRDRVSLALKPGGRLAIQYFDGVLRLQRLRDPPEKVIQEEPERIVRQFVDYDPERGAYLERYHNVTRYERCEYIGYVHTGPTILAALEPLFVREQSIRLDDLSFLDVYARRQE